MKRAQILMIDLGIPRAKFDKALSTELGFTSFSFSNSLRKQLQIKDELTKEIFEIMNKGELINTELIDRLILKNLTQIKGDLLFMDYPKTLNHFIGLEKNLVKEDYHLEQIWYFKHENPNQYMINKLQSKEGKAWVKKYGEEVIEKWETAFNKNTNEILEIQKNTASSLWKIVSVELDSALSMDKIKSIIENS